MWTVFSKNVLIWQLRESERPGYAGTPPSRLVLAAPMWVIGGPAGRREAYLALNAAGVSKGQAIAALEQLLQG